MFTTSILFFPFENHNSKYKLLDVIGQKKNDRGLQLKSRNCKSCPNFLPYNCSAPLAGMLDLHLLIPLHPGSGVYLQKNARLLNLVWETGSDSRTEGTLMEKLAESE